MAEKLKITNFAGIQHIELDLKAINVLIGPQAVGKSICAKLLYYFKGFVRGLSAYAEIPGQKPEFDAWFVGKFKEYFPPQSWPKGELSVRYELGNAFVDISRPGDPEAEVTLRYSAYFHRELMAIKQELQSLGQKSEIVTPDRWHAVFLAKANQVERISDRIGQTAGFWQLFIPAGRSFFAYLQSSMFSYLSSSNVVDPFLIEFGRYYEGFKDWPLHGRRPSNRRKVLRNDVDSIIQEILCGRYVREEGKDFLDLPDGRRTDLPHSSSAQQELLPLALILGMISSRDVVIFPGYTIYIEEPEAHLFPTAQRRIVELLATVFNTATTPLQFIVTTHSPYILTALNNLMQAGALSKTLSDKDTERLDKIVPASQRLDPDVVNAFLIEKGTGHSIKSKETNLITASVIDSVSNDLSIQFGDLLDLE